MINEKLHYKIIINSVERYQRKVSLIKVENNVETILDELSGDIDLVSSIKDILEKNKLSIENIEEFSTSLGPGSFTGLKMGVAVANVLNFINNKKKITEMFVPDYGREPNITPPNKDKEW